MPVDGMDCGELIGGPMDGGHVHTTHDQGRYGVVNAGGSAYYLRGRRGDGALRWVHSTVLETLGRQWRDRGGVDG